jgi:hypothetical protein
VTRPASICAPGLLAALLAACAPALDWRDARSADGAVTALFPCRPQLHERRISLAGDSVKLSLLACDAGGQTWGLASAELPDPSRHGLALDALAQAAGANVAAAASAAALQVPGATPHAGSRRLRLEGRRPDGHTVQVQLALFTHGTRVYQATVLGDRVPDGLADTYLESLRVVP